MTALVIDAVGLRTGKTVLASMLKAMLKREMTLRFDELFIDFLYASHVLWHDNAMVLGVIIKLLQEVHNLHNLSAT